MMTTVIHRYVEQAVLAVPVQILTAVTFVLTAVIFADFALSFKAALDLRDVLMKLEEAKAEIGRLQKRMDVRIAVTTDDVERKVKERYEELQRKRTETLQGLERRLQKVIQTYPTFRSSRYRETVEELRKRLQQRLGTK